MRYEIIELVFFPCLFKKKMVLDKQTIKIKLNIWLINEVQKSAWKNKPGYHTYFIVLLASMHCYYTSFAENCIPFTILNLLCVSSYFQSNYYILEICIREIILHILWCAVACSSNWSTFSTYESTNFIWFYCFSRCNYLFSVFWFY